MSGMINHLPRENCSHCLKNICLGQPTFECFKCNIILHVKCYKKSESAILNGEYYCSACKDNIAYKYNPFREISDDDSEDLGQNNELLQASNILNKCTSHTASGFSTFSKCNINSKKHCSSYFLNIDGNKSNFDSLIVELHRIKHKFSIIGLAEIKFV